MSILSEKRCSGCGEVKPVGEFYRRSAGDGFQNYCKVCGKARKKPWTAPATPEVRAARRKALTCHWCGKGYSVYRSRAEYPQAPAATYCSRACKGAARRAKASASSLTGGNRLHPNGYVLVYAPDHPNAKSGRVFEHVLVIEAKLGRFLLPGETVHHLDHDKKNNHPDNLQVLTRSDHAKLHQAELRESRQRQVLLTCGECGAEFSVRQSKAARRKHCSKECYAKAWARDMHARKRAKRSLSKE